MKKIVEGFVVRLKRGFIITLAVVLTINSFVTIAVDTPTAYAEEKDKSITILFTHDMHDNLLPVQSLKDGVAVKLGGYARLKSAIDEQKAIDPETLLVDGGDFSMGTPFQTIFQSDAPELRILGTMGYDVATLGNHEFDYRPAGLTGSLNAAAMSKDTLPVLVQSNIAFPVDESGNMTDTLAALKASMEEYGICDYTIFERNGVKIGVFGLLGEEAESMAPMSEVTFSDEVEQAKRVVKLLMEKENVDFILCLSHSGTNAEVKKSEDEILAKEVPEINMIVSGHTHTTLSEPILVGNTVISSAGNYGKNLGVVKMSQKGNGDWELDQYELVSIDDSFTEDATVAKEVEEYKNIVQDKYFDKFDMEYDEIVATSTIQFQTPDEIFAVHGEATIGNLISDAYIYSVKKAEGDAYTPIAAAIVPCGTIRDTILKGDITTANAFSISSLGIGADGMPGYPLISVYLTGKELKTTCEVDASITSIMGDAQLYMSGMNFTFNPNRLIFNKVIETALVNEDGTAEAIDDNKLYRIVCNLYSAQMLSVVGDKSFGLMSIVPKDKDGAVITDFEEHIIHKKTEAGTSELKEWYAVVQYLQSFDKTDGVSQISAYYGTTQGRKIIDHSFNVIEILSNPNKIGIAVYCIATVLLAVFILVIKSILNTKKKRKRRSSTKRRSRSRR